MTIPQQSLEITRNLGVEGFYQIQRIKASTGEVVQDTGVFPNLITHSGLEQWRASRPFSHCFVGTSSQPPTLGDTKMVSFVGGIMNGAYSKQDSGFPHPTPWIQNTLVFEFPAGRATGNLTEVGVGWTSDGVVIPNANNNRVFSRALILDASGQPTTLTVLADEILRVTYMLRLYVPFNVPDEVKVMTIGGVSTTVTVRNANGFTWLDFNINDYAWLWSVRAEQRTVSVQENGTALGPVTGVPTGGTKRDIMYADVTTTATARDGNTVTRPYSHRIPLNLGNYPNGIGYYYYLQDVTCCLKQGIQIKFDPPIKKTASQVLTFTFSDTVTINSKG